MHATSADSIFATLQRMMQPTPAALCTPRLTAHHQCCMRMQPALDAHTIEAHVQCQEGTRRAHPEAGDDSPRI